MVLGALLCVILGVSRFLARYYLVIDGHSKVVAGASYADVNFWLPGYDLIVACLFAAALILALAAAMPRFRAWFWMFPVLALLFWEHTWFPRRPSISMSAQTRSPWSSPT